MGQLGVAVWVWLYRHTHTCVCSPPKPCDNCASGQHQESCATAHMVSNIVCPVEPQNGYAVWLIIPCQAILQIRYVQNDAVGVCSSKPTQCQPAQKRPPPSTAETDKSYRAAGPNPSDVCVRRSTANPSKHFLDAVRWHNHAMHLQNAVCSCQLVPSGLHTPSSMPCALHFSTCRVLLLLPIACNLTPSMYTLHPVSKHLTILLDQLGVQAAVWTLL